MIYSQLLVSVIFLSEHSTHMNETENIMNKM